MTRKRPTRDELADQVKRLEEKLEELRNASGQAPDQADGLAESVVLALGKMVPGLHKLIGVAEQMPEFHDRLAGIDEEIKRRFKEQPLRRASAGISTGLPRRMGIPPSVRRGQDGRGRPTRPEGRQASGKRVRRGEYRKPGPPKVHISPETPEQLPVDVFDEDGYIVVLAEAHGLKRQNIAVTREEAVLVISVDAPQRKGVQRIVLPCAVAGEPKVSLAKGILKVLLNKAEKS